MSYFFETSNVIQLDAITGNSAPEVQYFTSPPNFSKHYLTIAFIDTPSGRRLKPSGGTALIQVSDDGVTFGDISNGQIDFSGDYVQPNCQGRVRAFSVKLEGITFPAGINLAEVSPMFEQSAYN